MIPSLEQAAPQPWYIRLLARPLTQMTIAAILLAVDFFSGPYVEFPILFIIPVVLAAQSGSPRLSYALAIVQPLVRFVFIYYYWDEVWSLTVSIINAIIRMTVLLTIAYLINRLVRLAHEVKRLEGLLPICSYCKKIRNEQKEWQPMETYISRHSQADFTHGICPDCARKQFGHLDNFPKA